MNSRSVSRAVDLAAARAIPLCRKGIARLQTSLLGRPECAGWDSGAMLEAFYSRAAQLRPPGGYAPARFLILRAGRLTPRVVSAAGALELGAVSHAAMRRYVLLPEGRAKFSSDSLLLMLASLTAYGIASGLLARAFPGRRTGVLRRFTTEMNRYNLRLASAQSRSSTARAAALRDPMPPDSSSSCLLRLAGFLAARDGAGSSRLEREALALRRDPELASRMPDAF